MTTDYSWLTSNRITEDTRTPRRRDCEICGDTVTRVERATKCGHPIHLCDTCKRDCRGARRFCLACEEKGR